MGAGFRRRFLLAGVLLVGIGCGAGYGLLQASLPPEDGVYRLPGLAAPVAVTFDAKGIPVVSANSREDAFRALGFVTARERLFQMDLLRRQMAGRLADVMGEELLESDRRHRVLGFEDVARRALERLPEDQKRVLAVYAQGVNQGMDSLPALPFEFWLLGYRPASWQPVDSLLAVLAMEEDLGWTGRSEHEATVMEAALPGAVNAFLLPPLDRYTEKLLHGEDSRISSQPIPKAELATLIAHAAESGISTVIDGRFPKGSNGWVVGPSKTFDGRAILANDMHLSLRVPNIWYRAELRYGDVRLNGVTLPGLPLVVTGSNGAIAWGFTNIEGDFVDLVSLETDSGDPGRYRTPEGYARFGERTETVRVRGGKEHRFKVQTTVWGPVLPEPLLSKPVAVHWTALDPETTDLNLLDLDAVQDVPAALTIFNGAGGPPLNALVADRRGNIGWTYTGKIPRRFGLDGSVSRSWADGSRGWQGYIPPDGLPRLVNPPSGFIVNANQRMLDDRYPYAIGDYFAHGYRAYRIAERLSTGKNFTEREMLALQLDTRVEFYRFYQRLALALPFDEVELRHTLESWDGSAERESVGLPLLVEFRHLLLEEVIAPYLASCRRLDPGFRFDRATVDEPLQRILEARPPELLPHPERYRDWDAFLADLLRRAARNTAAFPERRSWGAVNSAAVSHPFSSFLSPLRAWLDMPPIPLAGCPECVRVQAPGHGASERLVVAPGRETGGLLHMPGGQSGHPLSPHYADQYPAWAEGRALSFEPGHSVHRLDLLPQEQARR